MDKMNSDNNLNASTSVGSKESGIKSLQVVKRAIATNEKYSYLEHTHRNLEKANNEFDLQGSHILAEDWIKEAENAYRLLHPLELQPEIQREITTVMLSQMIEEKITVLTVFLVLPSFLFFRHQTQKLSLIIFETAEKNVY